MYMYTCINLIFLWALMGLCRKEVPIVEWYRTKVVPDTEMIKEFLSKYSTTSGKLWQQQQGTKHFIGRGLLMANGEDWRHQRHMVAPAFMGDRLKNYVGHMVECTKDMFQSLQDALEGGQTEVEIGECFIESQE
ncbi:hypothetical protein GLYMA_19G046266v4 [Glycine max]|nr:hypothetical protein GLYMA_19G046266v4 [Glycine max]KAH1076406.1 hypothetical protein GYH30_052057 [Glycine max]